MKKILLISLLLSFNLASFSQELNCVIQVNHQQISGTEKAIYQTLQTAMYEFMNNTKWTSYQYTYDEKIECSIQLTLKSRNTDIFEGQIMVQSTRPVYNSSYETPVFSYLDKDVRFEYIQDQNLEWVENSHLNNLTSILAYYAYVIIGMDFETFKLNSGTPFFDKAQNIINTAQSDNRSSGWKAFEDQKNRYWLVENISNAKYSAMRNAFYTYHRLGLDIMYENHDQGRQKVVQALEDLRKTYNQRPGLFVLSLFLSTKADEIVKMFQDAPNMQKAKVVQILTEIDASNASKYNKILTGSGEN